MDFVFAASALDRVLMNFALAGENAQFAAVLRIWREIVASSTAATKRRGSLKCAQKSELNESTTCHIAGKIMENWHRPQHVESSKLTSTGANMAEHVCDRLAVNAGQSKCSSSHSMLSLQSGVASCTRTSILAITNYGTSADT